MSTSEAPPSERARAHSAPTSTPTAPPQHTGRRWRSRPTQQSLRPRPAEIVAARRRLIARLAFAAAWDRYDDADVRGTRSERVCRCYVSARDAQLYRAAAGLAGLTVAQLVRVAVARYVLTGPMQVKLRSIAGPRVELHAAVSDDVAIYAVGTLTAARGYHRRPGHPMRAAVEADAGRVGVLVALGMRDAGAYLTLRGTTPRE